MTITRRQVLVTGAAALGASLMPARARAQGVTATLAFGPATPVYALGPIADAKGYFKAENLDFKLVRRQRGHARAPGARRRAGRCSRTGTPAIRSSSPRAARSARSSWRRR